MYVFFFKQKTAYEVLRSLVGSEMCIRDSGNGGIHRAATLLQHLLACLGSQRIGCGYRVGVGAVSYTHLTLPTIYSV